jgi:hypothetical protein
MEMIGRSRFSRRAMAFFLAAAAALASAGPAAGGTAPRFSIGAGGSCFFPFQADMRTIYGETILGLNVQAAWRFSGAWSVFAGYRRIKSDGSAAAEGPAFEDSGYRVRLNLSSFRGGLGYGMTSGRWTVSGWAGAATLDYEESWLDAAIVVKGTAVGLILAVGIEFAALGPVSLFGRVEAGPARKSNGVDLGGMDAVFGAALRF